MLEKKCNMKWKLTSRSCKIQASDSPFVLGADDLDLRMKQRIKGENRYLDGKTFTSASTLSKAVRKSYDYRLKVFIITYVFFCSSTSCISWYEFGVLWTDWTMKHMFTRKEQQGSYMGMAIILQLSIIKLDQNLMWMWMVTIITSHYKGA